MAGHLHNLFEVLFVGDDISKQIDVLAGIIIGISPIVHILLVSGINAPYGRYTSASWGPPLESRFAWFMQELPSFIIPVWIFLTTERTDLSLPAIILLCAFVSHYFNRVFVYSLSLRGGKPTPLFIMLMAVTFCVCNGYMQGTFLVELSNYPEEYILEWNFVVGLILFVFGLYTNITCDSILKRLRKPGEKGYKIPKGNMFKYVSAGNLWGEAVEWVGWALACWSIQAFAFATFAVLYLSGRSYSHHVWYLKKFENYPKDRKIFIPFLV